MKTVFITGTSSGLGKATVNLFHSKGWNVIATMRDTSKSKDFEGMQRVTVLPLDITDTQQIHTTVESAIALGNIDVVNTCKTCRSHEPIFYEFIAFSI